MKFFCKIKCIEVIGVIGTILLLVAFFISIAILLDTSYQRLPCTALSLSIRPEKTSLKIDKEAFIQEEPAYVDVIFGGDVMLARHVQTIQQDSGSFLTAWENIADVFRSADIAVVNLESPFSEQGPYPDEGFFFKARPENIDGLNFTGIDLASLANNHFGNAGIAGAEFTFQHLQDNNIQYVGAGYTEKEAYEGIVIERNGISTGFLAQSYDAGFQAVADNTGMAIIDIEKLTNSIYELKKQGADLVVAIFHGGIEYISYPNWQQKEFAYAAIDAGADFVIGHHPHWIQDIEKYNDKYIFYSLGNLIFDQNWSRETSEGLVLQARLEKGGIKSFSLLPILIEENFQPRFVDLEEEDFVSLEKIKNDLD